MSSKKTIGAGIAIDGEKEFKRAISDINSTLSVFKSEMKLVTAEFADNESSMKALKAQQKVMSKQIEEHSEKCKVLKLALDNAKKAYDENTALLPKMQAKLSAARSEYERTTKAFGKNSDEARAAKKALDSAQSSYDSVSNAVRHSKTQLNSWQKTLNETNADIHKMNDKLDELKKNATVVKSLKNAFETLTEKIDNAKEKTEKLHDRFSKLGDVAKKGVKIAAGAAAGAGTAVIALTKNAVENYAEYEQLIGGVETLFGAGGQSLKEYAEVNNATWAEVKDEYNSLLNSQQKVIDNANIAYKTAGVSANEYISTVTSFSASLLQSLEGDTTKAAEKADQALIDMADNANKMGTDMQSIQNAYQGFAKQNYTMLDNLKLGYGGTKEEMQRLLDDATALSGIEYDLDSYADVVDAIHVVQTEMGITGTTAKEASTTITGSISSMQASWQNLLTGIADENQNTDELIGYFVDSVVTAGENVIPVVEESLKGIGDLIEGLAPVIVNDLLPTVMNDVLPDIAKNATEIISTLTKGLSDNKEDLTSSAVKIITELGTGLIGCAPDIIDVGLDLIIGLIDGLTSPESMEKLIGGAIECVGKITSTIISKIPDILAIGGQIIEGLWNGIKDKDGWLREKISGFFGGVKQSIKDFFGIKSPSKWAENEVGLNIDKGVAVGLEKNKPYILNAFDSITSSLQHDVKMQYRIETIADRVAAAQPSQKIIAATYSQYETPSSVQASQNDKFDRMLALLEIIAANSKKDILLDKKTLVGELTPEVNEELGDILAMKERGA